MAEIYRLIDFEGKGLGCVATTDIKRGSLILNENPQIKSLEFHSLNEARQKGQLVEFIKSLLKSFNQMNKKDQLEFMALNNIYDFEELCSTKARIMIEGLKDLELIHQKDEMIVEIVRLTINKIEKDPEKAKKILKICNIFSTNQISDGVAGSGVAIKTARFNHSCQPNATALITNGQNQIRAVKNIKAGEEINICYLGGFNILRNKKFRQKLLYTWHFDCLCDLCKNDQLDTDAFEALAQEAAICSQKRPTSLLSREEALISYPLETCRKEIKCCKEIYEIGRNLKAQHVAMLSTLEQGFQAASVGYFFYKLPQFKSDAENFAKAVDKFGKFVGNEIVTRGQPDQWKQRFQNLEMWLLAQEVQERAAARFNGSMPN